MIDATLSQFSTFTLPEPLYLVGLMLFGCIGYFAYKHGEKAALPRLKWAGVALMLYPYAVDDTQRLYLCGMGLTAVAYSCRR